MASVNQSTPYVINCGLTCQPVDDGQGITSKYNRQLMVGISDTFASRFLGLKGTVSYAALSDAVYEKTGVRISGQAMHKWVKEEGGITLDNAVAIAEYFNVSPSWLLFGDGPGPAHSGPTLEDMIRDLPDDSPQQTMDFIRYKLDRAEEIIASDRLANYHKMIARITADLEQRKKGR